MDNYGGQRMVIFEQEQEDRRNTVSYNDTKTIPIDTLLFISNVADFNGLLVLRPLNLEYKHCLVPRYNLSVCL